MTDPSPSARSPWARVQGWLPLVGLCAVLGLFTEHHLRRLEEHPIPRASQHNAWELVPRMVHLFQGYRETERTLERGNWGYACPGREPIDLTPPALVRELTQGRLRPLLGRYEDRYWVEMPHCLALAAVAACAFPGRVEVPAMVMLGYVLLLIVSVYGIGREVRSPWTGLLAAALCAQSPAFERYALAVEGYLPVAALSAAMIWSLLRSRGLNRPLPALAFLGLAWTCVCSGEGFSEAVGAGLAVALPFLFELIGGLVEQRHAGWRALRPPLIAACLVGLFALLLDRTWALTGFKHILFGLEETSAGGQAADPSASPLVAWASVKMAYVYLSWTTYLGPIAGMALLLGLPWVFRGEGRRRVSLLAWLATLLVAYDWMTRKAEWYALPLIPPLAVVAAVGLTAARPRWLRIGTVVLGTALAVTAFSARGLLPGPWSAPLVAIEKRLSPDVVQMRKIGDIEARRLAAFREYQRFVAWTWEALPPDGRLHHVVVAGQPEVPLVHYAISLLRQDLEPVVLSQQPLAPCLDPDSVDLVLIASTDGTLRSLDDRGLPGDRRALAPWRDRLAHPDGAPVGVYRVLPAVPDP